MFTHLPAKSATAVLLFALPDAVEAGRKTVARQSSTVWRAMRKLTQAKVYASGLPLLNSNRLISHEGTFGEQMSAALTAAFAQGYEHIVCIGNDCPDLAVSDLRRAAHALANNQTPVGADRRGGVYMAGFSRAQFDARPLARLPWRTNQLADALREYADHRQIAVTELPVRADVNKRVDARIVRWAEQTGSQLLTLIQHVLLRLTTLLFVAPSARSCIRQFALVSGRAPPRG